VSALTTRRQHSTETACAFASAYGGICEASDADVVLKRAPDHIRTAPSYVGQADKDHCGSSRNAAVDEHAGAYASRADMHASSDLISSPQLATAARDLTAR
jgi:hypothetical protein